MEKKTALKRLTLLNSAIAAAWWLTYPLLGLKGVVIGVIVIFVVTVIAAVSIERKMER